jgi:hypothetical protein
LKVCRLEVLKAKGCEETPSTKCSKCGWYEDEEVVLKIKEQIEKEKGVKK